MAIIQNHLDLLDSAISLLNHVGTKDPIETLCLSTPDILCSRETLMARYPHILHSIEFRQDSADILRYHGMSDDFGPIIDTRSFLTSLNLNPTFVDIKKFRGYEKIVDLNEPLNELFHRKYKLILDTGTLEHCFNVGTAFRNMCDATDLGGVIITTAPIVWVNHGFWNFSPTAYWDGFNDNGFTIRYLGISEGNKAAIPLSSNNVLASIHPPMKSLIYCLAQRTEDILFKWPIQSKYKPLFNNN